MNRNREEIAIPDVVMGLLDMLGEEDFDTVFQILMKHIPESGVRQEMIDVMEGRKLPSLMSDVIAKKVFSPNEHPERLEYLLRELTGDSSITVIGADSQEGYIHFADSKKIITDISAKLEDSRRSYTEFQVAAQDCIFQRGDIYASYALALQYSVERGQSKGELDYTNVPGIILVFLMKNSPKYFKDYPSERYIHRFGPQKADSGLICDTMKTVIYVQLDKCLKQLRNDKDGENNCMLQLLLSVIADINDEQIKTLAANHQMLLEIYSEVANLANRKEMQAMMLAEIFAEADLNAVRSYERREGRIEIIMEAYKNGKTAEQIAEFHGLPLQEVKKIVTEMDD